jgi:DNA-binding transcriptional MocR family regulator
MSVFVKLDVSIRNHLHEIKGAPLAVYIALGAHINQAGDCFPSTNTLAEDTGYSRGAVVGAIKKLKKLGLINLKERGGWSDGIAAANVYHVNTYVSFGQKEADCEGVGHCTDQPSTNYRGKVSFSTDQVGQCSVPQEEPYKRNHSKKNHSKTRPFTGRLKPTPEEDRRRYITGEYAAYIEH